MSEAKPIQGAVRLGVEIEGIGYITIAWLNSDARRPSAMAGLAMADKAKLKEADLNQLSDMKETIKRQPLVRSTSFADLPKVPADPNQPARGVSIHAELPNINPKLGLEHPAELVSTPHLLDAQNLTFLKSSVNKVLKGNTSGALAKARPNITAPEQFEHTIPASGLIPESKVKTTFHDEARKIPTGIQTTVGVAANKLLSDTRKDRLKIIELLTAKDTEQRKYFAAMVDAACAADAGLGDLPKTDDQKFRYRLMLLMALMHVHVSVWKGSGMEKDVYGANIKGYSSFEGCAFEHSAIMKENAKAILEALAKAGINQALAEQTVEKLGMPDLSAQVAFEKGAPIACFLVGDKLHTVIEGRQIAAPINGYIHEMLSAKPAPSPMGIDPAATTAAQTIRSALGM